MLKLCPNILRTERQEFGQRFCWISIGHALDELMDRAHGIGAHIVARKIEDHVQDHVVQRLR